MPVRQRKVPKLIQLSTVTPVKQRWFWYPYIPFGSAILLFGIGGAGKSFMTSNIAANASIGAPLPGQKGPLKPLKSIILSAEDDIKSVLVPRLLSMGANMDNIFAPDDDDTILTLDVLGMKALKEYQEATGAKLIIIDPAVAFMGGKIDMFKMNEVREFTGPLHQWAKRLGLVVIIAHHARKGSEGSDAERAAGSADFVNGPRGALFLTKSADGTRIMRHVKTNYGPFGQTLAYSMNDGVFEWGEFLSQDTPNDTGTDSGGQSKPRPRGAAIEFLKIVLRTGPVPAAEVEALAADEGFSPATLQRAKAGVAESFAKRENNTLVWYWRLKETKNGKDRKPRLSVVGDSDNTDRKAGQASDNVPEDPKADSSTDDNVRGLEGRRRAARGPEEPAKSDPRQEAIDFLRTQGVPL